MRHEHYRLRQAKSIRNACAHSSAIINGFTRSDGVVATDNEVSSAVARIVTSRRVRTAKMRNPRIQQIATLLYLHVSLVRQGTGRQRAKEDMCVLSGRIDSLLQLLRGNDAVRSSMLFLKPLIDSWF